MNSDLFLKLITLKDYPTSILLICLAGGMIFYGHKLFVTKLESAVTIKSLTERIQALELAYISREKLADSLKPTDDLLKMMKEMIQEIKDDLRLMRK